MSTPAPAPTPPGVVSIGVAGALGPEAIGRIAAAVEEAGFHALWVNDTPNGDSLAGLRAAARATSYLTLATGVVPLDRRPADEIADAVRENGLPEERLVLGIGSGAAKQGALALVGDGVALLRRDTAATVLVGALGPKMRRLAAEEAGGVLLNWVTPQVAHEQAETARVQASTPTRVVAYARTAIDPDARPRLDAEVAGYAAAPNYAANFRRLGIDPLATVLPQPGDTGIRHGVLAYTEHVDELVLRAITVGDEVDGYLDFVRQAAADLCR